MRIEPCAEPPPRMASQLQLLMPERTGRSRVNHNMLNMLHIIRLDYLSCVLTVLATVLIGKKLWQGWVVAAVNSLMR